jgi:ATP-dependent DNA helicase RecQ
MQRAEVLEIVSISMEQDVPGSFWEIEIKDPSILNIQANTAWDRIFRVRDTEKDTALSELNAFKAIMSYPENQCVLQSVFKLVEGDPGDIVPYCGHCAWCARMGEIEPRKKQIRGLEFAWQNITDISSCKLPAGPTLISPEDEEYRNGLDRLLRRLAAVGFDQFLVPPDLCSQTADILTSSAANLGLVLGHDEWLDSAGATLARIPTAALLPLEEYRASIFLRRLLQFSTDTPALAIAIVARPDRRINERRLDQTVSRRAPYEESVLDSLIAGHEMA